MRFLFIGLFSCLSLWFYGQGRQLNNALKYRLQSGALDAKSFTLLVKGNMSRLHAFEKEGQYAINYSYGNIASVNCNSAALAFLLENRLIDYAELVEAHNRVMNDTMLVRNRILPVKTGAPPLSQAYNGQGVLMGIIDTGTDFNHNDFKDSLGHSRIKFLWDQAGTTGSSAPAPYNYGLEWTDTQIDAGQCTHSDLPNYGHGTHVSGIAAGNGKANATHQGCASKADMIVVALNFNQSGPTIADAVDYIFSKAALLGKPCVINASLGDYYGSHDGTNLEAKLIDNMVSNVPGRVIVAAAGNAGSIRHHTKTQVSTGDTLFTWFRSSGGSSSLSYWCYADTNQIKNVKISVGANRANTYTDLGRIGFKSYNYALASVKHDTLKHNSQRIGIVHSSASINAYGVYELSLEIDADTLGLNWRVESTGNGLHHAWNFDFVAHGLPSLSQHPAIGNYVTPDTLYTVVSSFQCSDEIITVGNYINTNRWYDVRDTLNVTGEVTGEISANSSLGPTRDERQKPDISASGDNIFSCMALGMQANLVANLPTAVAQGSVHVQGGGTSAASPVVAGLAALYLQRFPNATNQEVKTAIITCAYRDSFTGTQLPDYQWGYGKLDGLAAITCNDVIVGNLELATGLERVSCSPNPFSNSTTIRLDKPLHGRLLVYACDGRLLMADQFSSGRYELNAGDLKNYSGLLLVKLVTAESGFSFKLIKE